VVRCRKNIQGGRFVYFRVRGSRVDNMVRRPCPIWLKSGLACCDHYADVTRMFVYSFLGAGAIGVDPRNIGR
jgi:hypothetical protein